MTELGNKLKEARESKGLSLDDLQEATKIQKRYLVGIEEGNYSMMPGKFYVRAFIKQYCEAVGLETEEVFALYKDEVPTVQPEELPEQPSRVKTRKAVQPDPSGFLNVLPKILVTILILGIALLIWIWFSKGGNTSEKNSSENSESIEQVELGQAEDSPLDKEKAVEEEEKEEEPEMEKPSEPELTQELASVSTSGKNSTYQLKNTDKFVVKIVSSGKTWIRVRNENKEIVFQGEMNAADMNSKETEIDLTNDSAKASIRVGNATETEIYVNGEKLEYAVSPSDVVTQDITIDFVKE